MKKLILFLTLMLMAGTANAGVISYVTLSGDSGASYNHLNTSFSTAYDTINGALDSDNVQDDSLKEVDFADEINPRVRTDENIGDYTYTGMLPPTSTTRVSITTAGTSYVNGYRIVTDATSKTYTASVDTWVYIDQNGAFQYVEVALGAAEPTTPTNSLLLAKVTTNATAVTSVTDKRQLIPPALRIYSSYIMGCVISRDVSTSTKVNIGAGQIDFGSSIALRTNTGVAAIDLSTTGRGGLDTGALAQGYYYIFAIPDDGGTTNFDGVASASSTDVTGFTNERLVGWCYAPDASTISSDSCGAYKGLGSSTPNVVQRTGITDIQTSAHAISDMSGMDARFVSSGRPVMITYTAPHYDSVGEGCVVLSVDNAFLGKCCYQDGAGAGTDDITISTVQPLAAGTYYIKAKWYSTTDGQATDQRGATDGKRTLTVIEL